MIYGLVLVIHVLVALFLIAVILLQGGRGGMGEALGGAAAQSLFGGGANTVMTRVTAICAGLFMVTCLSLAMLSTARGRSVIEQLPVTANQLPLSFPPASSAPPSASPTGAMGTQPASPSVPIEATPAKTPSESAPASSGPVKTDKTP